MSTYDKILNRGKIEGKIEGEQIGIQKEKIETVLTLYEDKLPVEQIAKYARLSVDEVIKILKDKGNLQ